MNNELADFNFIFRLVGIINRICDYTKFEYQIQKCSLIFYYDDIDLDKLEKMLLKYLIQNDNIKVLEYFYSYKFKYIPQLNLMDENDCVKNKKLKLF